MIKLNEINTLKCGSTTITFKVYSGAFFVYGEEKMIKQWINSDNDGSN